MSLLSDPVVSDEALVLRWFPVTDTSRVVVWFTARHGRISTLIKGSQRPKSWLLGQYDLFYTCELLFYAKANEDLHMIRECAPLAPRSGLRQNWRACAAASFVADLLYRISPPLAAAAEIYKLATDTLDQLHLGQTNPALLFWFELKVLADLGLAPNLQTDSDGPWVFDFQEGRICPAGQEKNTHAHPVTAGSLFALRALADVPLAEKCARLRLQPQQIKEITRLLASFSEWHLDLSLPSRHRAMELLMRETAG